MKRTRTVCLLLFLPVLFFLFHGFFSFASPRGRTRPELVTQLAPGWRHRFYLEEWDSDRSLSPFLVWRPESFLCWCTASPSRPVPVADDSACSCEPTRCSRLRRTRWCLAVSLGRFVIFKRWLPVSPIRLSARRPSVNSERACPAALAGPPSLARILRIRASRRRRSSSNRPNRSRAARSDGRRHLKKTRKQPAEPPWTFEPPVDGSRCAQSRANWRISSTCSPASSLNIRDLIDLFDILPAGQEIR